MSSVAKTAIRFEISIYVSEKYIEILLNHIKIPIKYYKQICIYCIQQILFLSCEIKNYDNSVNIIFSIFVMYASKKATGYSH